MAKVKKNSQDEYNAPFATALRGLLDSSGISQSVLADYIGVTRQAISSYSLGTSLPDIEKFEKIADYFDVSTEFLLGRTGIKKADTSKQATAAYLGLSEEAIDAIHSLQGFHLEQNIENDYKLTVKESEPLPEIFSEWLAKADLSELMSNVWQTLCSTIAAQDSGWNSTNYILSSKQKEAIADLKEHGYTTLSMTQQVSFFSQSATDIFNKSIDKMIGETIQMVNEQNQVEGGQ